MRIEIKTEIEIKEDKRHRSSISISISICFPPYFINIIFIVTTLAPAVRR